jgi:hypothetical protein
MALLGDVERIAVVGAEREEGRQPLGQDRHQRVQVLGDGALADEDMHALADLFERLLGGRAFMIGADAGGEIAVQVIAAQERRVAIDMAVPEGVELGEAAGSLWMTPGKVHELGKADDLRMVAEGQELASIGRSAPDWFPDVWPARRRRAARGCP